jgi:hypothetical protein
MKWEIIYDNGISVSEDSSFFSSIDKQNIRQIFFVSDEKTYYGINLKSKVFFINNKIFDFKIKGKVKDIIQYKRATFNFSSQVNQVESWNVGIEVENDDGEETYILCIFQNGKVFVYAKKQNKELNISDERTIPLN